MKLLFALALLPLLASAQTIQIPPQTCTAVVTCQGMAVTLPATPPVTTPPVVTPPAAGTFWIYRQGVFNWGGDYSFGGLTVNYKDTVGKPGSFDIACSLHGQWGGFLPYAGGTVPLWNFDATPYNALTFAFKPTLANQTAQVYFVKVNDVPVGVVVDPFSGKYGPKPQVGTWASYSIPLADLGVKGTSVYKFAIQDQTGSSSNVFYLDDIGFTK